MRVQRVPCDDIRPDSRSDGYAPHEVAALADDIRAHGVLRPLLLRETPVGYVIVHGERRWQAARMAGLDSIPAYLAQEIGQGQSIAA